ncbi:MAG: hypothetical protein MJD61_20010, partial [Proteobacteria bacterium]|nr:hypothetical protein [Pseudomonadota bacterium]
RIDNQQRDSGLPFVLWLAAACTMLSLACGGKTTIAPGGAGSFRPLMKSPARARHRARKKRFCRSMPR